MSSTRIAASLNPPAITELDASSGLLPPWILLDARVYFADRKNSTTAILDTANGHTIQVSICVAVPPALSYVCIHCPGYTEADFPDEPRVVRSEKQFLLLHLSLWGTAGLMEWVDEYYMYQATHHRGKPPKLFRIPDLRPRLRDLFTLDDFGIYCCEDEEEYILAGLTYTGVGYRLHTYSSASKAWTARRARFDVQGRLTNQRMPVKSNKVISLGGSLLGWVDLWKGILVCDVLCQDPQLTVGFIPLPLTGNTFDHICPWVIRDVACINGSSLKFIEIQQVKEPTPVVVNEIGASDVIWDEDYFATPQDHLVTEPKVVDWRATIWNRLLPDNCWRKGFDIHGSDILVEDCTLGVSSVSNLLPYFPTLSISGDHVVHMTSSWMLDTGEEKTQMISVDMSNNTLKAFTPCPPVEADDDCPYFPCVLSKYLSNPPALPRSTQASFSENVNQGLTQIVQPSHSENITGNKRPRFCSQEIIGVSNGAQYYPRPSYGNYQQSLPLQQQPTHLPNWFSPSSVNPHPPYPVVNTSFFRPMAYPFPQNDSRLLQTPSQANPHPAYPVVNTTPFRPMVYPFPQNDSRLLQTPSQGNPHPAYPVVNTTPFRPMVYPFPQNDSRLLQTPSQANPYPTYPVVNTSSFRPMVYPFPQNDSRLVQTPFQANPHPAYPVVNTASFQTMVRPSPQNNLRLAQAQSQALLPPAHFSTPSIPPAAGFVSQ